jgi:hypothetical protein
MWDEVLLAAALSGGDWVAAGSRAGRRSGGMWDEVLLAALSGETGRGGR